MSWNADEPKPSPKRRLLRTPCHTRTTWLCTVHVGVQLLESVHWNWHVQPVESKLPSKAQVSSLSGWIVTIPRSTLPDVQCAVIGSPSRLMMSTDAACASTWNGESINIVVRTIAIPIIKLAFLWWFLAMKKLLAPMMEFGRNSPELLIVRLSTNEAQGEDISHRNEGKKPRMRWEGRNQQRRSFNPNGTYTHMNSEQIPTESPTNGTRREKLRKPRLSTNSWNKFTEMLCK